MEQVRKVLLQKPLGNFKIQIQYILDVVILDIVIYSGSRLMWAPVNVDICLMWPFTRNGIISILRVLYYSG